jgi:hypothetical protein
MQHEIYPVLNTVKNKLDFFLHSKKIPHIIFHGPSGTGKRTIVNQFLSNIYGHDKVKMKSNIMFVNCAHGKGIKFIREELKFFAKSNIQFNCGVMFKTIVLLNADFLTIDAQSALRRCIELFSFNTRFFIIIENKHKLLNPILSRFCDIYIPETIGSRKTMINLHQHTIQQKYPFDDFNKNRYAMFCTKMKNIQLCSHKDLVDIVTQLYELGYSCLDIIRWFRDEPDITVNDSLEKSEKSEKSEKKLTEKERSAIVLVFYKIKSEFRCEKMIMFYMLDYAFLRQNKDLKNIGFM